jgi:hypothetical protein
MWPLWYSAIPYVRLLLLCLAAPHKLFVGVYYVYQVLLDQFSGVKGALNLIILFFMKYT